MHTWEHQNALNWALNLNFLSLSVTFWTCDSHASFTHQLLTICVCDCDGYYRVSALRVRKCMIWSFHSVVNIDYSLLGKYIWLKNKFYRELDALCSEKSKLGDNCREPVGREALRRTRWWQGEVQGCLFRSEHSKNQTADPTHLANSHILIM